METVTVSRPFRTDLAKVQARCRSLDSRLSWPGTVTQWETGSTDYDEVGMRLSPAPLTDITVTEELGPDEIVPGGTAFRTRQRVTWPEGTADAHPTPTTRRRRIWSRPRSCRPSRPPRRRSSPATSTT